MEFGIGSSLAFVPQVYSAGPTGNQACDSDMLSPGMRMWETPLVARSTQLLQIGGMGTSSFQHLSDLLSQRLHRKRFLQEIDPFIEDAMLGKDIAGIARHEDGSESGLEGTELLG
jgi:hypothetical protein